MIPIKFQCISTPQYHVDFGIKEIHAKAWQEVAYNHIYSATLATLFYLRKFCTLGISNATHKPIIYKLCQISSVRSKTHQVWIPGATILSCKRISLVEWLSCAILAIRQPCLWVPWKGISWAKDASMRTVIGLVSSPQMRKCKLINEGGSPWMRKCKSINEGESPCSHWITHTSKVDLVFEDWGAPPWPSWSAHHGSDVPEDENRSGEASERWPRPDLDWIH